MKTETEISWFFSKFVHFMPQQYNYIDMGYLEEMSGGKKELIFEMIDIFKKQVPEFIDKMHDYAASEDWKALGKISHKAKASAAIMGMTKLATDLKAFELMTNTQDNKLDFIDRIRDFENRFNNAMIELDNYVLTSHKK